MSGSARRLAAIARLVAAAFTAGSIQIPAAHACNYHDTVGINRGILNWVYPDSLHVRTAVWMAQDAGLLPLFEAMLWSRFAESASGIGVSPHTSGPQTGDVVVITDEPVIGAILDGRLTPRQARQHGMLRFFGKQDEVAAIAAWFDRLAAPGSSARR